MYLGWKFPEFCRINICELNKFVFFIKISFSFSLDQSFIFDTLHICYKNIMNIIIYQITDFNHSFGRFCDFQRVQNRFRPYLVSGDVRPVDPYLQPKLSFSSFEKSFFVLRTFHCEQEIRQPIFDIFYLIILYRRLWQANSDPYLIYFLVCWTKIKIRRFQNCH